MKKLEETLSAKDEQALKKLLGEFKGHMNNAAIQYMHSYRTELDKKYHLDVLNTWIKAVKTLQFVLKNNKGMK